MYALAFTCPEARNHKFIDTHANYGVRMLRASWIGST